MSRSINIKQEPDGVRLIIDAKGRDLPFPIDPSPVIRYTSSTIEISIKGAKERFHVVDDDITINDEIFSGTGDQASAAIRNVFNSASLEPVDLNDAFPYTFPFNF